MRRATLSVRDRRALLVMVTVIPAVIILGRGVPMLRAWRQRTREHAAAITTALARAEARRRMQHVLIDSLNARRKRFSALTPALVSGKDAGSAGATLAGLIADAATTAEVRLGAVQPTDVAAKDAAEDSVSPTRFARVAARADVTGDIDGLMQFLTILEGGPARLSIRTAQINQPDPAAPPSRMETLGLTFTVEGLMLASLSERKR